MRWSAPNAVTTGSAWNSRKESLAMLSLSRSRLAACQVEYWPEKTLSTRTDRSRRAGRRKKTWELGKMGRLITIMEGGGWELWRRRVTRNAARRDIAFSLREKLFCRWAKRRIPTFLWCHQWRCPLLRVKVEDSRSMNNGSKLNASFQTVMNGCTSECACSAMSWAVRPMSTRESGRSEKFLAPTQKNVISKPPTISHSTGSLLV